jgi:cytochrome c-type biogenesis protein CcmH
VTVRQLAGPVSLAIVLLVALLVGSGAFDKPAPAAATRIASLERQVRCPSCQDLSVAQSISDSSIAVRNEIARSVAAGQSDAVILHALVARFGPSILLEPPPGGLDTLLWVVPLALGAGALVVGVAVVLRRRATP